MPASHHFVRFKAVVFGSVAVPLAARAGPLGDAAFRVYARLARRLPPKPVRSPIHAGGFVLYHDRRPSYTLRSLDGGGYERATAKLVERRLRPGANAVDAGAHVGYFTLLMARAVGTAGHVWAFEPDPATFPFLLQNVEANGFAATVTAVDVALSETRGTAPLYASALDSGSSSLVRQPSPSVTTVPVTTLDAWAGSAGWPRVDLVKMDIEGSEQAALHGMHQLVARNPQMALIVELNPQSLELAGSTPGSLVRQLRDLGFTRISTAAMDGSPVATRRQLHLLVRRARWSPVNLLCEQAAGPG
jgi:FkbM family methyltransferase